VHPVFPGRLTFFVILGMLTAVIFAMRVVQPAWWRPRAVRIGVFVAFGTMILGLVVWAFGARVDNHEIVRTGAGLAYIGVLVFAPAAFLMPASAAIDRALVALTKKKKVEPEPDQSPRISRRALIRFGSASLPAMAAMTGASGFVTARQSPTTPIIRLRYPALHPHLDGLRILQLSDLHLGAGFDLGDLERGLAIARDLRPDLIVLTGDLADDTAQIEPALRMVHAFGARYGALASLGNHEYLHGIEIARPAYERSPIPLLVGTSRVLRIGDARLHVGGADDPVHMGGDIAWMLEPSIAKAMGAKPPAADFRLLLCHRPEGFVPATKLGFDLTMSGHTHGGQIGFLGRSLFDKLRPGHFWWGAYARERPRGTTRPGPSRLYTTSGFGHWFPFRLGCPTEMPLVVLERG
jgi:predicted MPP superfamily phosphohydrolase